MVLSRFPNSGLVNALDLCQANCCHLEIDASYETGMKRTHVGAGSFNVMPAGRRLPLRWSIL